ncbi:hypothetical protein GCM10011386_26860 [Parapedobacter defluvii]|uniref:Uncharacterized protein n=2 Tax=Parapedobacter defluvii TaxID=2045106 RepID=A0ABQ1M2W0_9SPHI|nr:hypothetical protein GCM10011386_26860 [Parapedobacter defluvii]
MHPFNTPAILRQPIDTLGMSREFTVTMEILGFVTLGDLASRRSRDLLALPGFTRELLYEYVDFMEVNGMGKLIDP